MIFVSLDTLRADAVAGSDSVTPRIDEFLADAVFFERATTELPFTLSAHMSLLTGTAPDVHRVFGEGDRLAISVSTLAEVLSDAGYRTKAVVSSDWLAPGFGFGRGFDSFERLPLGLSFAGDAHRRALDWLASAEGTPFLFLHDYDPHSDFEVEGNQWPYWAPEGALESLAPICRKARCEPEGECATGYLLWANRNPRRVPDWARECLLEAYRAGVRGLDRELGLFFEELRVDGWYDRSLIVLTSDHGEEFGEHGQYIHAQTHHETVAIPLAFKLPGGVRGGTTLSKRAQLADVAPTTLALLGIDPPSGITGRNLFERAGRQIAAVSQNKHRRERYAITLGGWKLIHDFVDERSHLFNLVADPGEEIDLAATSPRRVRRLRKALEARIARYRALVASSVPGEVEEDPILDEAARDRLRALGYLQ